MLSCYKSLLKSQQLNAKQSSAPSLEHGLKMLGNESPHVFPHIPTMQYIEFETGETSASFKQC